MHPYLFPTGVNGAPSFLPGGNPTLECKTYWMDIRRALLREPVDRIGFGGYLHLVENHPDFIEYITALGQRVPPAPQPARERRAVHGRP